MSEQTPKNHWANIDEVGVYWLMRIMFILYNLGGKFLFLTVLYPVVSYYFLMNKQARSASMDYLQRFKKFAPESHIKPSVITSYRHFLQFAVSMVDKLAAWTNRLNINDVVIHGREGIAEQLSRKQGGIILGSHLGNIEICRALATIGEHAKLNILVHTKHAKHFNRLLREVNGTDDIELIQVTDIGPTLAISLDAKISAGEMVFIVGDRIPVNNHQRTSQAMFLGSSAYFAQGPFILAALMKCPVYTLFCLKQQSTYHLYFEQFCERIVLPRKNREIALSEHIQRFANRLQEHCLLAPLQWFNFYPYWQKPAELD